MTALVRDLRLGWRALARSPGFAAVAVLSLALGIGANATIFSFLNALLLRPLPYSDPGSLVDVSEANPAELCQGCGVGTSFPAYLEWRERATSFARLDAYREVSVSLADDEALPEVSGATQVSAGLLESLGARPLHGRLFVPDDDRIGAAPVVILGHRLWRRRYGADAGILGRSIRIDGRSRTVVGILGPRFAFPEQASLWLPITPEQPAQARDDRSLGVLGRLRPGVTTAQATAEMATLGSQMAAADPATYRGWIAVVGPYRSELQDPMVNLAFTVALAAAGLVLLIACANLANLQLARSAGRAKELAIRAATGASRRDLVRLLLTESLLVSLAGGVAALLAALWGVRAILALIGGQIPAWIDLSFDWRVFAFTAAVALATGVLFGLAPALRSARTDLQLALKTGAQSTTVGRRESFLRDALTVVQVTLATVLVIGAGLMVKAFAVATRTSDLGHDPAGVLRADVELREAGYAEPAAMRAFAERVLARLEATAGVQRAAIEHGFFLGNFVGNASRVSIEGRPEAVPNEVAPRFGFAVSPAYFDLHRLRVIEGRGIGPADRAGAPLTVVVDQVTAGRLWPGASPLGKRLRLDDEPEPRWYEVVGVVASVLRPPARVATPVIYTAFDQRPGRPVGVLLRAAGEATALADPLRRVVAELDRDQPVRNLMTLEQHIAIGLAPVRVMLGMMATLGAIALALAAFGLYAVLAYLVARRTRELGIRMALGATGAAVLRLVLGRGTRLTALAILLGLPLAYGLARVLASMLYSVRAADPMVFLSVPAGLALVALAACWFPARRAARVDPLEALRAE
jgi:putative ABC transport system permease protein